MVEQIMFIGIGFLIAGLLVIGVIPLVHARAVRLTMRRLEALTPLSMAEIQADKDQLRAEFAMTMSRLEMNVEQMKAKTTNQLADLARKSEAIGRLKLELGEKTATLFALEAKEKRGDRRSQARARRKDRDAVCARSQGKAALRRPADHAGRTRRQNRRARGGGTRARERADRTRPGHRQLQRRLRRLGQPARRIRSVARADRSAEGPDR